MDEPRRIPIHRALNRPNLIFGGERELVLMTMLFACLIAFTAASWMQVAVAVGFWIVVHGLLVEMAKHEPFMSQIYLRAVAYRSYYPAATGMQAPIYVPKRWKE